MCGKGVGLGLFLLIRSNPSRKILMKLLDILAHIRHKTERMLPS